MASSPGHDPLSIDNGTPTQPKAKTRTSETDRELLRSLKQLSLATTPGPDPLTSAGTIRTPPLSTSGSRSPLLHKQRSSGFLSQSDAASDSPSTLRKKTSTNSLRKKTSTSSLHSSGGASVRTPSRRGSAQLLSPAGKNFPFLIPEPEPKPAPTPFAVARDYFKRELEALHGAGADHSAETVVILHDACYGHRFSRPTTKKFDLLSIVERPERIQASVLGVSLAYVRLGDRHCDGKYPIHPDLDPLAIPKVPFRILKTDRRLPINSPAVTNVHGSKWMEELKIMCDAAEGRLAVGGKELQRPDMQRKPDTEPPKQLHQGDLYLCSESLNAFEGAMGAVCEAVDAVFSDSAHKRAFVAVRPPGHHCSAGHPSGFCWLNNVHVGIMHGILNHGLTHTAIIDFDLHHGDGSQSITWAHNKRRHFGAKNVTAWKKTSIGYFSIHDINSYPCEMGDDEKVKNASMCIDNAHGQNIWNVHLQEWKTEVDFWRLYQTKYSVLLEKTRNYLKLEATRYRSLGQEPKAAIFLSSGFDASEWESDGMQRHKVNVPTEFYARLTRDVVKIASEEGMGVDGRVISVLEGGYSDRALYSGVMSHLSGLAGNEAVTPSRGSTPSGLNWEMSNRRSSSRRSTLGEGDLRLKTPGGFPYDPDWWAPAELDRLDAAMAPTPPPEPKKTTRSGAAPTYSSPTTSSNAKMTEVAKFRRSVTNLGSNSPQQIIARPPTPPPPDVPWTSASHALSKLLIPSHRQVDSHTMQELSSEARKVRIDRLSLQTQNDGASASGDSNASIPSRGPTRMSLRERRPAKPPTPVHFEDVDKTRRRTTGDAAILAQATPRKTSRTQAGRRLSGASTTVGSEAPDYPESAPASARRPGTSQAGYGGAAVPSKVSTAKRPAVPTRKESSRAPRSQKKSASTNNNAATSTAQPVPPVPSFGGPAQSSTGAGLSTSSDDVNKLTNGMKKIKINVVTKAMKEARAHRAAQKQQEIKSEDPVAPSDEPRTGLDVIKPEDYSKREQGARLGTPLPDETSSLSPTRGTEASLPRQDMPGFEHRMAGDETQNFANTENDMEADEARSTVPELVTPMESSTTPFSSSPILPSPTHAHDSDLFVRYQPDGPPGETVPLSGPVQILEPNTNTPGQPHKSNLPFISGTPSPMKSSPLTPSPSKRAGHGFTATSAIPFAPQPTQKSSPDPVKRLSAQDFPVLKPEDDDAN